MRGEGLWYTSVIAAVVPNCRMMGQSLSLWTSKIGCVDHHPIL
jgi:hypothetical protein